MSIQVDYAVNILEFRTSRCPKMLIDLMTTFSTMLRLMDELDDLAMELMGNK